VTPGFSARHRPGYRPSAPISRGAATAERPASSQRTRSRSRWSAWTRRTTTGSAPLRRCPRSGHSTSWCSLTIRRTKSEDAR